MDSAQTREAQPVRHGNRRSVVVDWGKLTVGDHIVLLSPEKGGTTFGGIVDAISADSSILWLQQDECAGRRLFHQQDGYKTLLDAPPEMYSVVR